MKRLACLALALLCLCCLSRADFGDFSGGSDYGNSSSSSSSYDSSSYSSSSYDSSYSSSGSYGGSFGGVGLFVLVGVVVLLYVISKSKKKNESVSTPAGAPVSTAMQPLSALENVDEGELTGRISNMYVRLQEAWAAQDLRPVEPLLTGAYYAQMEAQLKRDFIDPGITSHLEHISVLDVTLSGCRPARDGRPDQLYARLRTRFVNYLTDREGKIVRGSRDEEIYMEYEWTLVRSGAADGEHRLNCPNCGAPVDVNRAAVCPFCGTTIESPVYDWTISQIRGLSRRTVKL